MFDKIIFELKAALKQFGEYSFDDKGPGEVMDIYELEDDLMKMSVDDVAATFKLLLAWDDSEESGCRGERLASCLVGGSGKIEKWDDLWEKHGDFLETFY